MLAARVPSEYRKVYFLGLPGTLTPCTHKNVSFHLLKSIFKAVSSYQRSLFFLKVSWLFFKRFLVMLTCADVSRFCHIADSWRLNGSVKPCFFVVVFFYLRSAPCTSLEVFRVFFWTMCWPTLLHRVELLLALLCALLLGPVFGASGSKVDAFLGSRSNMSTPCMLLFALYDAVCCIIIQPAELFHPFPVVFLLILYCILSYIKYSKGFQRGGVMGSRDVRFFCCLFGIVHITYVLQRGSCVTSYLAN